jgi:hypothetical protein
MTMMMEEELMPELVAMVLSHVDHLSLVACSTGGNDDANVGG